MPMSYAFLTGRTEVPGHKSVQPLTKPIVGLLYN